MKFMVIFVKTPFIFSFFKGQSNVLYICVVLLWRSRPWSPSAATDPGRVGGAVVVGYMMCVSFVFVWRV